MNKVPNEVKDSIVFYQSVKLLLHLAFFGFIFWIIAVDAFGDDPKEAALMIGSVYVPLFITAVIIFRIYVSFADSVQDLLLKEQYKWLIIVFLVLFTVLYFATALFSSISSS